jgi:hypothetical protein
MPWMLAEVVIPGHDHKPTGPRTIVQHQFWLFSDDQYPSGVVVFFPTSEYSQKHWNALVNYHQFGYGGSPTRDFKTLAEAKEWVESEVHRWRG